jgi:hypothetical protein
MDLDNLDDEMPPMCKMAGVDLITEGTITLTNLLNLLECAEEPETQKSNGSIEIFKMMLDSDIIEFLVGTRINQAHQSPTLPVELDIRRNLVKKIVSTLSEKYLKKTNIIFV